MTKHYCLLLSTVLTFFIFKGNAQGLQNYFGIKGGIAVPNLTAGGAGSNPLSAGYSSRLGPDAAVFWEHGLTKGFSITPGIEYSSQGGKRKGFQAFPFPTQYAGFFSPDQVPEYLYADFKNEVKLNYIMLNVLAKFNWHLGESSPVMLYAEAGPFGAYLLSAKDVTGGYSLIYRDAQKQQPLISNAISFDNTMDVKSDVHKGNFGITGDIGLAYNFSNNRIFIEAGGNYGLMNIQKDPANGKNGIGAVNARIGYAISFGSGY